MPNTVVKLTNAESTWLEAAREDRKLLINMKAHLQRCAFFLLSFGSRFKVQGLGGGFAAFFYWGDARKWYSSHGLPVITTIRVGPWRRAAPKAQDVSTKRITYYWLGSSHMRGMRSFGSVPTCFGWGFSHIERFRPLRMTIHEGGRALIWVIRCVFWN